MCQTASMHGPAIIQHRARADMMRLIVRDCKIMKKKRLHRLLPTQISHLAYPGASDEAKTVMLMHKRQTYCLAARYSANILAALSTLAAQGLVR